MNIYHSIEELPQFDEASVTIGNFDGLHIGHKMIIDNVTGAFTGKPGHTIALTFARAPIEFLNPSHFKGYIFPPGYKQILLEKWGIGNLVDLDFGNVLDVHADEFIKSLKDKIKKLKLTVGYNFRFGKGNTGTISLLEKMSGEMGFGLTVCSRIMSGRSAVSSSSIRDRIESGDVLGASGMLGRPYFIVSRQVKGDGIGGKIGFPTINLEQNTQVLPGFGVYFTLIKSGKSFLPSMTYVGKRPTIDNAEIRIETNVISDNKDLEIYRKEAPVTLFFIIKTRNEKKYHNLEDLRKNIYNDRRIISSMYDNYDITRLSDLGGL